MPVDYSPEIYSALPTVAESAAAYQRADAGSHLNEIGRIFLKHSMQQRFGISLLHRHFSLPSNEHIVEYGGVATAWPVDCLLPAGSAIRPTNWTLKDGVPQPYEFEFVPGTKGNREDTLPALEETFTRALYSLLEEDQLLGVLGLVKLPAGPSAEQPTFEATIGRASITFPGDGMNKGVDAMWRFEDDGTGVCARVCSQCSINNSC